MLNIEEIKQYWNDFGELEEEQFQSMIQIIDCYEKAHRLNRTDYEDTSTDSELFVLDDLLNRIYKRSCQVLEEKSHVNQNKGFSVICNECGKHNEIGSCPSGAIWIECECGNRWGD